jgi:REP element-mobilizing transposase RayT
MPQSLSRVLVHLIFSTKNRARVLSPEIRAELFPYLSVVLNDHDCPSLRVGGVEDHVHLFFGLSRTHSISQIVEAVTTSSSKWMKTKGPQFVEFHWQAGYGAFSVSPSQAVNVTKYIVNQEEHHRVVSFQDEFRRFLERHGIAFDERYVWD